MAPIEGLLPNDGNRADCIELKSASTNRRPQRPTDNQTTKDYLHRSKVKEGTMRAQAKATTEMAATNAEKAAVMGDQAVLQTLFHS